VHGRHAAPPLLTHWHLDQRPAGDAHRVRPSQRHQIAQRDGALGGGAAQPRRRRLDHVPAALQAEALWAVQLQADRGVGAAVTRVLQEGARVVEDQAQHDGCLGLGQRGCKGGVHGGALGGGQGAGPAAAGGGGGERGGGGGERLGE
jgi:hypothetical protein